VRQVGHVPELYRDARSTEYKMAFDVDCVLKKQDFMLFEKDVV
jgi:hypothetical protein